MNLLEVKNLKSFYGKAQILFDVNLNVKFSEIVALIGKNGVGKTTTLKSIVNLVKKTGSISFNNNDITNLPTYKIAKLGLVFIPDRGGVFPDLTVEENLKLSEREGKFNLEYIYDTFPQIKNLLKRKGAQLSGGERRLVGIVRALLMNPKLILIDEPSEGLAPVVVKDIKRVIQKLKKEQISILFTDQNLSFVKEVSDRIYIMDIGQIKLTGKSTEIPEEVIKYHLTV